MPVTPTAEQRRGGAPSVQQRAGFPAVRGGPGQDRCWDPLRTSDRADATPGDRGRLPFLPRRHVKWLCSFSLN